MITRFINTYGIITFGALTTLFLIFFYSGSYGAQKMLVGLFILFYLLWAVAHHIGEKTFRTKIILEYCLIALIAFLIIMTL